MYGKRENNGRINKIIDGEGITGKRKKKIKRKADNRRKEKRGKKKDEANRE